MRGWFTGRLPQDWFTGPVDVSGRPRGDHRRRHRCRRRRSATDASDAERAAAVDGRVKGFREDTRDRRIAIAREAEHRFGRKVAWGVECDGRRVLFTHLSVPVMTRLRQPERRVLDTLVEAGVARSRSEALAWCGAAGRRSTPRSGWASCARRWSRSTGCGPRGRTGPGGRRVTAAVAVGRHRDRDVVHDERREGQRVEDLVEAEPAR